MISKHIGRQGERFLRITKDALRQLKKNWINAKYDFHIKINKSVSLIRYFQEHELFKLIVLNCVSSNDMSNFEVTRRIEWEHNSGISQLGTFLLEQKKIKKEVGKKCPLLPGGLEPPTFALLQHQLGYCADTAYKYDALTDCATGAG